MSKDDRPPNDSNGLDSDPEPPSDLPEAGPTPTRQDGRNVWVRIATSRTVWVFVVISVLGALSLHWMNETGGPDVVYQHFGALAPMITITLHIVLALTPFPSDVIAIANGAIYGFWMGLALSWFGWWLAALAEFALGRRARSEFCLETALKKAPVWVQAFPVSHPSYLILSRQIPWLGGHVSTFVPGAAGVSWRRYAWCSAIAIVPGSIVMTGIGVGIMNWPGN